MQTKCLLFKKQPALHCPLYIKRHCFISSSSTILQHIIMKVGSRVFSAITLLITCFQHFAPHHTTVVYLTFQRPKYFRERNGKRPCAMEEYIVSKIFRATMSTSRRDLTQIFSHFGLNKYENTLSLALSQISKIYKTRI